jgi:hypothetical protein
MVPIDHRQSAQAKTEQLISSIEAHPRSAATENLLRECTALRSAIAAFHMEGIRFRMYNVDRLLTRAGAEAPAGAAALFDDIRRELEAAGFHTRSHQAPTP